MRISLNQQRRAIILAALRLYQEQGMDGNVNHIIVDDLFLELQPTGMAIGAEPGDVVMWKNGSHEVVHNCTGHIEIEDENDSVIVVPLPVDNELDPLLWPSVRATELTWPNEALYQRSSEPSISAAA